jgi:hypothetical protein
MKTRLEILNKVANGELTPIEAEKQLLVLSDVRQRFLNIKGVMDLGEIAERSFFNWLRATDIWWTQKGSNLEIIVILEKDIEVIKKYWSEVNVA